MLEALLHFNSIKVRLELPMNNLPSALAIFQFHKGTIRTSSNKATYGAAPQFQFHKGTIRTHALPLPSHRIAISIP